MTIKRQLSTSRLRFPIYSRNLFLEPPNKPGEISVGYAIKLLFWMKVLFFICLALVFTAVKAQNISNTLQYIEYLNQQKSNLSLTINQLKFAPEKTENKDLPKAIDAVNLLIKVSENRLARLNQSLLSYQSVTQQYQKRKKQLMSLQVNPVYEQRQSSQLKVERIEEVTLLNKQAIELLNENIRLSSAYIAQLKIHAEKLNNQLKKHQLELSIKKINDSQRGYAEKINKLMDKSIALQRSDKQRNIKSDTLLEIKLVLNNQQIKLYQLDNDFLSVQKKQAYANYLKEIKTDTTQLQKSLDYYQVLQVQLNEIIKESDNSIKLLEEQYQLLESSSFNFNKSFKQQHTELIAQFKDFKNLVSGSKSELSKKVIELTGQLKQALAIRHELFNKGQSHTGSLLDAFIEVPKRFYQHMVLLGQQFWQQIQWLDNLEKSVFLFIPMLFLALFFYLKRLLASKIDNSKYKRVSTKLISASIYLFEANLGLILFILLTALVFKLAKLPFQNYQLVFTLLITVLVFRLVIGIARITLFDRLSDISGRDVKLYHRLRWSLLFGMLITCLMLISNMLMLSPIVQELFNRLLMVFLLSLSLILLKSREVIPSLLRPFIRSKRPYFKRFIRLLTLLIPAALLINAIVGLFGYIDLAWAMGYYQALFLAIASGYVILRGVSIDVLEVLADLMIKKLNNGWLWSEVFLKPLDKILRMGSLLVFTYLLFLAFGWASNELILSKIEAFLSHAIVNFSGIHITILSSIEFIILLSIFIWAAKWTREISYRWLFKDVRDAGIRNSLSVFSQYTLIIVGTIITLRVLGIDFTGMSVVLGGLAVGMGFGLRDFASNIIGGFMLLIERPVREGDLITLGNYEGRVAHIGIRSMRVRSWDNMEVLIPNAETFNKPFTNWTHQDSIVRTVIPIKVQVSDDPVMIQQLIFDVLHIMPDVLQDPSPQVYLKQIDEALVVFEVRYFINIDNNSRVETRSKVLFAITAQFKAAGIKPPIPPIQITHEDSADKH